MDISYYKMYEPIFGAWKIKEKIGEGNFGSVFIIEREDFGVTYRAALKAITIPKNQSDLKSIIEDGLDDSERQRYLEQFVEKIVSEFVLMSKLKGNSNIVSYEDHQVIKHQNDIGWDIFIRMELLTPMMSYFKQNHMTRRDVIKLGIDMCRALELCQRYSIIHRDIKPENIFISDSGEYKLGDFGIAKEVENVQSGLTKTGTPTYMAPEVYKGQTYGSSVDIYSLGVVLYRLLNHNRAPFMPPYPNEISYSDKEKAFVMRISGQSFPMPTNAGSGRLAEIAIKACSYNPEDRYSSPTQMREDLEAILYSEAEGIVMFAGGDSIDVKSISYDSPHENAEDEGDDQTEVMDYDSSISIKKPQKKILRRKNKAFGFLEPIIGFCTKHIYVPILIAVVAVATIVLSVTMGGDKEVIVPYPSERVMMSDAHELLEREQISGFPTELIVQDAVENKKYHTYTVECTVHIKDNDGVCEYGAILVYDLNQNSWQLNELSRIKVGGK